MNWIGGPPALRRDGATTDLAADPDAGPEAVLAASDPLFALLAHRPALAARFRAFYDAVRAAAPLPAAVLTACRLRIAAIHGCEAEWLDRPADLDRAWLPALETGHIDELPHEVRVALVLAERMPFGHHAIEDGEVAAATAAFTPAGAVALLTALAFFDVVCRMRLTLGIDREPVRATGE